VEWKLKSAISVLKEEMSIIIFNLQCYLLEYWAEGRGAGEQTKKIIKSLIFMWLVKLMGIIYTYI